MEIVTETTFKVTSILVQSINAIPGEGTQSLCGRRQYS